MGRFVQPAGDRGSLRWIQRAVNQAPPRTLDTVVLSKLSGATSISWRSPVSSDDFAEYRDKDFLDRVGAADLAPDLANFWPALGPQWDGLGVSDAGDILLIEAKAHIDELLSPGTKAGASSRARIAAALNETKSYLRASPLAEWTDAFYQLTNRLAHLYFLRKHGKPAWLVLVNFTGDADMRGPASQAEWEAAYTVAWHVLGLPKHHLLSRHIIHLYPAVAEFAE